MSRLDKALDLLRHAEFTGTHCIFTSLAVRDFLRAIGVQAEVKSVALIVTATQDGLPLHSLGIGMNALWGEPYEGQNWDGHLIVTVGSEWIIDPTFHQARRAAWSWTPGVAVVERGKSPVWGLYRDVPALPVVTALSDGIPERDDYRFEAIWFAYSRNTAWKNAPDARDPKRRRGLIDEMLAVWRRKEGE